MPPSATRARSWDVTVTGAGKTMKLTSVSPVITFADDMPSPEGDLCRA